MERKDKEGKLMLLEMHSIYDLHPAYGTLRTGLAAPMGQLTIQIGKIISAETGQSIVSHGDTINKQNKFDTSGHSLFLIASAASGFASSIGGLDPILKAKVDFSLAQILGVNYVSYESFANNIIDAVTPVIGSLGPFGAVALDLTTATGDLTDFLDVQNVPQVDRDEKRTQTANIHPFVTEGKRILSEMCDPIVNTLFSVDHDLYKTWYNGREIHHLPSGTTVVEGYVYKEDGVTGIYLADVKFPAQNINLKTYIDGSYRYVKFPHGVATPTATVASYPPNTAAPYEVKQGKIVHHNFIMTGAV